MLRNFTLSRLGSAQDRDVHRVRVKKLKNRDGDVRRKKIKAIRIQQDKVIIGPLEADKESFKYSHQSHYYSTTQYFIQHPKPSIRYY